jgi:hypothetical protein
MLRPDKSWWIMTLVHGSSGVCGCRELVGYVRLPFEGAELLDESSAMGRATVPFWEILAKKNKISR